MLNAEQIFQEIQKLPSAERRRLITRLTQSGTEAPVEHSRQVTEGEPSLVGLFADEPELVDEICKMAMESRKHDKMRTSEYEHKESSA